MRVSFAARSLATSAYRMNAEIRSRRAMRADVVAQIAEMADDHAEFVPLWHAPVPSTAVPYGTKWERMNAEEEAAIEDFEVNYVREHGVMFDWYAAKMAERDAEFADQYWRDMEDFDRGYSYEIYGPDE